MPRALFLLPTATYRATDFLRAAAWLGMEVAVASERPQALADEMQGRFLQVDFEQPEASAQAIVEWSRQSSLDAVIAVDDAGVVTASLAALQLGLPHNPPQAARSTRNKLAMRTRLAQHGINQPAFAPLYPGDDAASVAEQLGYPVVVKPVDLSASRGVLRADSPAEAREAVERISRMTGEGCQILIERYLAGSEFALEGLLRGGSLEVLALFDKPDPMEGPTFAETILVTPSRLAQATQAGIAKLASQAVAALGLREGPVHAEFRVVDGKPAVLEVASRSIGGLCGRSLRFGLLGRSLEEVILRAALGLPALDTRREQGAAGVLMLPVERAGRFQEVVGIQAAVQVPGITEVEITVAAGRKVRPLPEGDRYLGFVFARGESPEDVETALRLAWATLSVVIN